MAGASAVAASDLLARERRKSPKAKKTAAKAPTVYGALAASVAASAWSLGSRCVRCGTGCGEDAGVGCDQLAGLVLQSGGTFTQGGEGGGCVEAVERAHNLAKVVAGWLALAYQALDAVQTEPASQQVAPVQELPPHCAHFS